MYTYSTAFIKVHAQRQLGTFAFWSLSSLVGWYLETTTVPGQLALFGSLVRSYYQQISFEAEKLFANTARRPERTHLSWLLRSGLCGDQTPSWHTRCEHKARRKREREGQTARYSRIVRGATWGAGNRRHSSLRQYACAYRLAVQQQRQGVLAPSGATREALPRPRTLSSTAVAPTVVT